MLSSIEHAAMKLVSLRYPHNTVTLRGKHQWKIVLFDRDNYKRKFYPVTLGRGCSIGKAWVSALEKMKRNA